MQQQLMALEPSTWLSRRLQERRRCARAQRRVALPSCQFCGLKCPGGDSQYFLIASVCFLICARTLKDDFVAELGG